MEKATDISAAELTSLLLALAELYEWEMEHSPFLNTIKGRHLYFKIANRVIGEKAPLARSMKDLYHGANISEKALRLRLREFETQNFIRSICDDDDARVRCLMPSESMYEAMYLHAQQAKKIFSKDFLVLKK